MILYIANSIGKTDYKVEDCIFPKWEGIYSDGKIVEDVDSFIEKISKRRM